MKGTREWSVNLSTPPGGRFPSLQVDLIQTALNTILVRSNCWRLRVSSAGLPVSYSSHCGLAGLGHADVPYFTMHGRGVIRFAVLLMLRWGLWRLYIIEGWHCQNGSVNFCQCDTVTESFATGIIRTFKLMGYLVFSLDDLMGNLHRTAALASVFCNFLEDTSLPNETSWAVCDSCVNVPTQSSSGQTKQTSCFSEKRH